MDNMINFLLENAKQTIINTRIALSAVGIWDHSSGYDTGGDNGAASAAASETDTASGFNTGSDLPQAWD